MELSRRDVMAAAGGALLSAGALQGPAGAAPADDAPVLYGHGMVWNRELPGEAGELNLRFDLRVNLETGQGSGVADDPVHPDWAIHFDIQSVEQQKRRRNETRYLMEGVVTRAANPNLVGQTVKIAAETRGETTAIAIGIGELAFGGAGLVVIAIIAILIGLLLPAVQ